MNVYLSFDVEIWCPGWASLDADFPRSFDRYVFGRSAQGDYALPRTLDILNRHGLVGVFFVEPLFALRFGRRYLKTVTDLIVVAGQDVQLHLHPEWVDEIRPALLGDVARKRQHLSHYTLQEQTELIRAARHALEDALSTTVAAFRAGSYAVNLDTYRALRQVGLLVDSSLNDLWDHSAGTIDYATPFSSVREIEGVTVYPVSVFRDGFGRARPLQVGACSAAEMEDALLTAHDQGCQHLVLVSHNFEMLKTGRSEPDPIVVGRFERLCAFLDRHRDRFVVGPYPRGSAMAAPAPEARPRATPMATTRRHVEQLIRRLA